MIFGSTIYSGLPGSGCRSLPRRLHLRWGKWRDMGICIWAMGTAEAYVPHGGCRDLSRSGCRLLHDRQGIRGEGSLSHRETSRCASTSPSWPWELLNITPASRRAKASARGLEAWAQGVPEGHPHQSAPIETFRLIHRSMSRTQAVGISTARALPQTARARDNTMDPLSHRRKTAVRQGA